MVARVVGDLAALVDDTLTTWIDANVSFVTTMVDRITPRSTDEDRAEVARQTGVDDPETVPTEPFSEWVLAGAFPAGRPAWESAGATFVDDVRPFETRKLWLLNGSHSLLAYAGSLRGHETVADAIADPVVRSWVEEWWDAAAPHLDLPAVDVSDYRQALLDRYRNPHIRHLLSQIAADGSQKVPIRAVPVIRAELDEGHVAAGATRIVAAWVAHLRGHGAPSPTRPPATSSRSPRANRAWRCGPCSPTSASSPRPSRRPWRTSWRTSSPGRVMTAAPVVIGLDIGTTAAKVVAFEVLGSRPPGSWGRRRTAVAGGGAPSTSTPSSDPGPAGASRIRWRSSRPP